MPSILKLIFRRDYKTSPTFKRLKRHGSLSNANYYFSFYLAHLKVVQIYSCLRHSKKETNFDFLINRTLNENQSIELRFR